MNNTEAWSYLLITFHYLLQEGTKLEDMEPLKVALDQYVAIHFQTEEALMKETGYPNLVEHALLHQELAKKIEETSTEVTVSRDPDVALSFLREWWLDHINKADREFSLYVKRRA